MEVIEAIHTRRSIRSFKPEPVPREVLEELLDACRWAPSASNTQPWEFAILGGAVMEEVKARIIEKIKAGWDTIQLKFKDTNPDIPYPELTEPYRQRAVVLRTHIDSHQFPSGTKGLDEKRATYLLYGGYFYGAPNAIILYTEKSLCPKAILDLGVMAQTIGMAALAYGLGTCLMTMTVFWPDMLREMLEIPDSKLIALGIAIGYPDSEAIINTYERTREPLDTFTHWHGV